MDREEVTKWLKIMKENLNAFPEINCGKKIEALAEAIRLLKNEQTENPTGSTAKNDLGVREFEEIVVEYPPEDLCSYPEYKGKPYFSIKYKEGNDCSIGYGTYNPKVFSRYLRDYFMPIVTPQPRWISDSYGNLPDKNGLYLVTYDYKPTNQHEVIIARFSIPENEDDDEFRWYDETDIEITLGVTAWMPLPKPYREVEE